MTHPTAPHADFAAVDRAASAGANMTGEQHDYSTPEGVAYLEAVFAVEPLHWNDRELKRVTNLRLLSDPGLPFWDVSYCHGVRRDGHPCRVILPFDQLPKHRRLRAIVEHAKRDGVFAKGLGIIDAISTLQ